MTLFVGYWAFIVFSCLFGTKHLAHITTLGMLWLCWSILLRNS